MSWEGIQVHDVMQQAGYCARREVENSAGKSACVASLHVSKNNLLLLMFEFEFEFF
jgi:hypothetical protein